MPGITAATESFIADAERFANRRFRHRLELGLLIDALKSDEAAKSFEELIFYAKFLTHAGGILARKGIAEEETREMAKEYAATLQRALGLLEGIRDRLSKDDRRAFEPLIGMTHGHMKQFMSLLNELSWIKNYLLDTKATIRRS
jgi:hypothetical protein